MLLIFIGSGVCVSGITQSFPSNKMYFLAYTFIYIFHMMEGMSPVLWNYFLSFASAAVTEGSCCAWSSTFCDVHMGQQSLFQSPEHLQQPEKLALDLWPWTCLCTGCSPAIEIPTFYVWENAAQWMQSLWFVFELSTCCRILVFSLK